MGILSHLAGSSLKVREYYDRLRLFDTVMGFVKDCRIEGDYLEFGCAYGGSLSDAFQTSTRWGLNAMKFYIFDSFEGLPEPEGLDADSATRYDRGEFACDMNSYKRNVQRRGVDLSRVTLTPGWYNVSLTPETAQRLPIKKAAVVLIDCDLYESTVPVLDFITPYVQDGTVFIIDDWFSYKGRTDLGEAQAFKEWLAANPTITATEYHMTGRTMMSFILQVTPRISNPQLLQSGL
jgi:O-methyltransferase